MSITQSLLIAYSTPAGTFVSITGNYPGGTECNVDQVCANAATTEIDVSFIKNNIQSLIFFTNVSGITIRTNSNSSPQDTINLSGSKPIPWNTDLGGVYACPFSNNVSKLFVTNTNSSPALFQVRSTANN